MTDTPTPNKTEQLKKGDVSGEAIKKAGDMTDNRMVHGRGNAKEILKDEEE